jgi:hypothetical protein
MRGRTSFICTDKSADASTWFFYLLQHFNILLDVAQALLLRRVPGPVLDLELLVLNIGIDTRQQHHGSGKNIINASRGLDHALTFGQGLRIQRI